MLKIMKFTNEITELKPRMVDRDTRLIVLPKSLKKINPGAILLNDPASARIEFEGTFEEAERIMIDDYNDVLCIHCSDGRVLINKL